MNRHPLHATARPEQSPDARRRRLLAALPAAAALGPWPLTGRAAALDGPLTVVVPYAPGGTSDVVARVVAERLQPLLGVTVVVDNRTGAGGRIAMQQVKRTPASQNVIVLGNPAVMVVAPVVFKDAGYEPADFAALSNVSLYDFAIAVGREVPVKALTHLVAWLRANPNSANFGVPATGSLPHFFGLMLGELTGLQPQIVGYRGSAPLATDLIGGSLPVGIDTLDALLPQHAAGKLRILAMSGRQRASFAPDIPTFNEAGLKLSANGWNAFFAPASMPAERRGVLAGAIATVMKEPAVQARFTELKLTPVSSTATQTETMLEAYRAQWLPVVKRSNFQA